MTNTNQEVPLGAGAVIVNGDTGEVFVTPLTEAQEKEIEMMNQKISVN
jgi:hypothetical protein